MHEPFEDLLTRAFTEPSNVLDEAQARMPSASAAERCQLLRALGTACRELRRTSEARSHHEAAFELAHELGDHRLEGLSAMSLSATLTYDGEFERALTLIDRAIDLLDGEDRLTALSHRAGFLQRAGRHRDALDAFDVAFAALDGTDDPSLEADLLANRGVLHGWLGELAAAEADTQRALDVYLGLGWDKPAADLQHNMAWLAGRRGDIVEALRRFDMSEATYESAGVPPLAIFPDRCEVLLAAGLAHEALALAERSAASLADGGDHVDRAEALLLVARSAILAGDPPRALAAAEGAATLFGLQQRQGWSSAAECLAVESRLLTGTVAQADVALALSIADSATDARMHEVAIDARLLAGDIAAFLEDWSGCQTAIGAIDQQPVGLVARFRLAHLRAQCSAATGDNEDAIAVCAAALDMFAELSAALGGTEMRASVAVHANRLAALGLRLALDEGDTGVVLQWAERQRASALAPPPVQPPEDPELESELNELRTALVALDERTRAGAGDPSVERRVANAQERVRRRVRRMPGNVAGGAAALRSMRDHMRGDATWVVFVESDRHRYALHARDGDVELVDLGSADELERMASNVRGSLSLHLRAMARGVARDPSPILRAAAELDQLLFVDVDAGWNSVVVCPVGTAYDLPWGLLPTLRDRPFVLTPSIAAHLRCQQIEPVDPRRVVAVSGPGLTFAEEEVRQVIDAHGGGEWLTGGEADAARVRDLIAGAEIAHIVCHGRFVFESPMFSSLELHGGPIFVHEFERLRPCPRITVLSACHAGVHTSPTEREILGLSASLVAAGARSVVAATFAVPDSVATVAMMRSVHDSLASGADVASALCSARALDPLLGGAFVCHGAAWDV